MISGRTQSLIIMAAVCLMLPLLLSQQSMASKTLDSKYTNTIGMEFVLIPGGHFMMGSPGDEKGRLADEHQRRVSISRPFYMMISEVTQDQWEQVMGGNPSKHKGGGDWPVDNVSWKDAQEFIRRLNAREGASKYQLPTEAQWEYACRCGKDTAYNTGDVISTEQANYDDTYAMLGNEVLVNKKGKNREKPSPVKSFGPNEWGLYDMHGNVGEMCNDWYISTPLKQTVDPVGPERGVSRVTKGGTWASDRYRVRCAARGGQEPGWGGYTVGFRLIMLSSGAKTGIDLAKGPRFKRDGQDVITDHRTFLQWYVMSKDETGWHKASSFAENLSVAGGGWRLPGARELQELNQPGSRTQGPTGLPGIFPLNTRYIWTSQALVGGRKYFFPMHFDFADPNGKTLAHDRKSAGVLVVRKYPKP